MTKRIHVAVIAGKKTCLKRKIATEREAKRQLKRAKHIGVCNYYRCRHCESFHLTSERPYR